MIELAVVTDRTGEEVLRLKELRAKIINRTATPEEVSEWLAGNKSVYTLDDLNRVEGNTQIVAEELNEYGYYTNPTIKTDWTDSDIPTKTEMDRYIGNVQNMKKAFCALPTTPDLPDTMDGLTFKGANAIEQTQVDLLAALELAKQGFRRCGTFYSGQGVILP